MNNSIKMVEPTTPLTEYATTYNGTKIVVKPIPNSDLWEACIKFDGRSVFKAQDASFAEALQQAKDFVDEKR